MVKEKKEKGFVDRVVSFLKLDDAGRVEKFQKQAVKVWEKQVDIRRQKLVELQEKQDELVNEKADEIVLNVNLDSIKTIEDREEYILRYQKKLLDLRSQIDSFDDQMETLEEEIEGFNWLIDQVK